MEIKTKVITGAVALSLISGSVGVYAGTIIERYKTPRGNIATVEKEEVHKNRVGITVNGKSIKQDTWYANGVTYAPIRDVATTLGASVNYNTQTWSADIVTSSNLLDLLGLKIGSPYYAVTKDGKRIFKILQFNPNTNEFTGTYTYTDTGEVANIEGKISETKLRFKSSVGFSYDLDYFGGTKEFKGKIDNSQDITISLN